MRELQEWLYGAITSAEAPPEGEILARLTEVERLEIYRGMYEVRMAEALANDYPAVAAVLGEHDFGHLASAYAAEHPSSSYTLNRLGDAFPAFLADSAPGCLVDLARLELAMTEVFDEEETPLLAEAAIAAVTAETRLPLIKALRLLALGYPVNELFQAYRDGEALVEPQPAVSWLVVYRRDYAVRRLPLTLRGHAFLSVLAAGATLGEACAEVEPDEAELFDWFRDWSAAGLLGRAQVNRVTSLYDLLMTRVVDRLRDPLLLALRLFIGWQFFITGKAKLGNIGRVIDYFGSLGIPMPELTARFIATLETVGGLLLLIGLAARLIAIPLSINMIVAYLTADRAALSNADAFTSAAEFPFLLISLVVLAFGAGLFSLDALIGRRMRSRGNPRPAAIVLSALVVIAALPLRAAAPPSPQKLPIATFSMGCFWCAEDTFEQVPGVVKVVSGYTGGTLANPTYEEVSGGGTGHRESVEVNFDPAKTSYEKLLDVFWHNVDPLDHDGQFCDKGPEYRAAIFYHDDRQRLAAQASYEAVKKRFGRIYTDIIPASPFWPAEEYHQHYATKNPVRYHFYRFNCGRDARLEELWK